MESTGTRWFKKETDALVRTEERGVYKTYGDILVCSGEQAGERFTDIYRIFVKDTTTSFSGCKFEIVPEGNSEAVFRIWEAFGGWKQAETDK